MVSRAFAGGRGEIPRDRGAPFLLGGACRAHDIPPTHGLRKGDADPHEQQQGEQHGPEIDGVHPARIMTTV
jgi:hypothetical protein